MLKKLSLLAISVVATCVACEVAIRYRSSAWPFERPLQVPEYLGERDATLHWRFSPANGRNSLGLRNREVGPKSSGTVRILFLGDSLIWTGETTSGPLYTEVLERRFNTRFEQTRGTIEIVNAGIPGYTTFQELEFLKTYGLEMNPDLVVLGFVFNDVYFEYLHRPTARQMLDMEPSTYLNHFDAAALPWSLFGRSYLAHTIADRGEVLWKRLLRRPRFSFERRWDFYLAWKSHGWDRARQLVVEMNALLQERGIPLVVLVFPVSEQVDRTTRERDEPRVLYPQRRIREICEAHGIPMLDLTAPLERNGGKELFKDYLHLNGKGNDVVADQVEEFLSSRVGQMVVMKAQ